MNESTDSTPGSRSGRAPNLKQRIKQDGKEKIESGKRAAADQIADVADAIDLAGSHLDQSQPTLANYASKLAESIGGIATRLREGSVEDVYRDVRQLATRHPGMFLVGSAAVGLLIARFMKASGEEGAGVDSNVDSDQAFADDADGADYGAGDESLDDETVAMRSAPPPESYRSPASASPSSSLGG